jgi:anti-sigma factor RsiW
MGTIQLGDKTQEEARLTRYLLGELSEGERERLEESYFTDDGAFEQILIAEEELIDAYARGELSAKERQRFEGLFLASPRGRERVKFARSLADAASSARPAEAMPETLRSSPPSLFAALYERSVSLRYALLAAALAAVIVIPWLVFERAGIRNELRQLRDERAALREEAQELERRVASEQTRSKELLAQLESERAQSTQDRQQGEEIVSQQRPPQNNQPRGQVGKNNAVVARRSPGQPRPPAETNNAEAARSSDMERLPPEGRTVAGLRRSVSFDLTPGLVRGGGANALAVPARATFILLQLNLETDSAHENYRAVIETVEGRPVWRADSIKPRLQANARGPIELPAVPARNLSPGNYVLLLTGELSDGNFEGVADYSFKIVRK